VLTLHFGAHRKFGKPLCKQSTQLQRRTTSQPQSELEGFCGLCFNKYWANHSTGSGGLKTETHQQIIMCPALAACDTPNTPLFGQCRQALEQDWYYSLIKVRTDGQRLQVQLVLNSKGGIFSEFTLYSTTTTTT
jgi:hypothetical protein